MSFSRVNPAGWALFETLTSAQANALDINASKAVDGDAGGSYSPSDDILVNARLGGRPVKFISGTGAPASPENGDAWYDDTGDDRINSQIDGAVKQLVFTDGTSQSRVIRVPMSMGQQVAGGGASSQWTFSAINNQWESQNHNGTSWMVSFPLNGLVPQDATLTEIKVRINSGAGLGSTSGVRAELVKKQNESAESVIATGYDGGAGVGTITLSALSEVLTSDDYDYFVRVRTSTNTDATYDIIHSVKATFDLPVETTIP